MSAGRSTDPVILLLHGVSSSSRMFEKLTRVLGGRYRLIALGDPGSAKARHPLPTASPARTKRDEVADPTDAFMREVGVSSMGER